MTMNELSPEYKELAKRIDNARTDIATGKGIKLDLDNFEEIFES